MKDNQILDSIKRSVDEAPIDILDNLKSHNVVKMMKHDDITRQEKKMSLKPIMSFASIAAAFLLIFFNFQQLRMPESEIYLDVNPGIHITTNKKDEVIKLEAINQEAINIIEGIDYKGREIDDVTEEILDSLMEKSYIEFADEVMLLSVFNKDRDKGRAQANQLNELIHKKLDYMNLRPIVLTQALEGSNTVEEFANRYGISFGKMTFIRNMIILNPDLKTEDLVALSIRELIEISQRTGIDIEGIIESSDMDRIPEPEPEPEPTPEPEPEPTPEPEPAPQPEPVPTPAPRPEPAQQPQPQPVPRPEPTPTPSDPSLIGEARAKEIALARTNGGRVVDIDLDWDDGTPEYEVEIINNGYEYEIEIDGYTGKILDVDRDELDDDDDDDDDD